MAFPNAIRITGVSLYFLPINNRVPLKFGAETVTSVTCARVKVRVVDRQGRTADGWGETPLSVTWVWPSSLPYPWRQDALKLFTELLAKSWSAFADWGHPL